MSVRCVVSPAVLLGIAACSVLPAPGPRSAAEPVHAEVAPMVSILDIDADLAAAPVEAPPLSAAPPAPAGETAAVVAAEVKEPAVKAAPEPGPAAPEPAAAAPATPLAVVLFVHTTGDGWTASMRQRAGDMLRLRIGADERFVMVQEARIDALGERARARDPLSVEWLQANGDAFADLGPVVFLRATLHLEQRNSQDAEGRPAVVSVLTVSTLWSDVAGERRGGFSTSGHLLTNDNLIAAAVAEFHTGAAVRLLGGR